jgi:Tetratricopeptide repeat
MQFRIHTMQPSAKRPLPQRLIALAALVACSWLGGGAPVHAADKFRPVLEDPHFGDSVFHFYQEHYFSSVTSLMVSQHFNRIAKHADEAEVLRGGLLLSYGLHREAGAIFARLIENNAPPAVQDRAWFYLAKIRYQRGLLAEASEALTRIGAHLPPDLKEEHVLLHANVLMARQAYREAAKMLAGLPKEHSAGPYVRYNLGVALIKTGEIEDGIAMLEFVGRGKAADEEARSLRDRANLALGMAALREQRPDLAKTALERVRLNGMLANKALLGFGWAEAEQKNPRRALVAWSELAARDASDAAVLEAKLAVPYAYTELGAYRQSLEGFEAALDTFDTENKALDESIAAIRSGALLRGLLDANPGEEMGWFWNIRMLPDMPHSAHLAQVLAGHEFQEAFKNYRDLTFLANNLQSWLDKLVAFEDMLANRRKAYAERLPQIRAAASESGLGQLQRRRDALADELARAEYESNAAAFADSKQLEMLERMGSVREILARGAGDPQLVEAAEQLRRVAGALTWQLAQDYSARLWDVQKALKEVDTGLAGAREREAALRRAQIEEPVRFDRFGQRIVELAARIRALIPRVAALKSEQQGHVQELAVAELVLQKEHLAEYVIQARFAVAQLHDRAQLAQDSNNDKQP